MKQLSDSESTEVSPASTGSQPGFAAFLPSTRLKVVFSVLIIFHLLAVFLPPLAFQANGPFGGSPSVGTLLRPVEGYGEFLYLNRGYAFFAPDPGPSHLIQVAVTDPSGQVVESMYPDLDNQWPRLKYHRHFMLAEFLTDIYQPPGPPPELAAEDPAVADEWTRLRARYEHVRQSIVDHLKHVNDGKDVAIRRIEHLIPSFIQYVEEPIALDDPRLYTVLLDQSLDAPLGPPETIPPPVDSEQASASAATGSESLKAPLDDRLPGEEADKDTVEPAHGAAEESSDSTEDADATSSEEAR